MSPREERKALEALERDVGRVREIMLAGGMGGDVSLERRPSTMERPVWPVAPMMAIVGAIVGAEDQRVRCCCDVDSGVDSGIDSGSNTVRSQLRWVPFI